MNALRRLPVFFVICLLVLLPVSVAAQIAASTSQSYFPSQQEQKASDLAPESDFSAQAVCVWPNMDCAGGCWTPCSTGTWYCGSTKAVCCSSSAKFCADKCWTQCSSDYIWVCTDSGAVCKLKSECTDPKYFIPCGGGCWSGCGSGYRFECVSGAGQCKRESCTDPSYPYWCGNNCWSGCGAGYDFVCNNGKGECKSQCKDNDGDGYGNPGLSSCSKGSATDCNDNNANVNPGMAEVCSDGVDNDCDGKADGADTDCCPGTHPNYCLKNNLCWKESWMCENSIKCSSTWQVCSSSSETAYCDNSQLKCCPSDRPYYINGQCEKCMGDFPVECGGKCWTTCGSGSVFNCNGGNPKCCPGDFPVYCQRTDSGGKDACWKSQSECDTAQKCGSEGWTVCREPSFPYWNCRSDGVSKCCPTGYPYMWNSDYLCHTTPEQVVTCTVPDGLSSQCDCNSNSDCPADKPYCEENYPAPISDGYDACIASEPEYCGNGKCVGSETFSSCVSDCGQLAPKGTISVDVYYSSGANANKPISGAYVSIDGVQKGTTDNSGKKSFEASYGSRNVKVECPDGAFCAEKTVGVDGIEYVGFGCGCNPSTDSDGDGYSNEDEGLLGTDPKDPKESIATVFASYEYKKGCLDKGSSVSLEATSQQVVKAFNVTSVLSQSFEEKPELLVQVLSSAGLMGRIIVSQTSLREVAQASEEIVMLPTDSEVLVIATDEDTGITSIFELDASCSGTLAGIGYGAQQSAGAVAKGFLDLPGFLLGGLMYLIALPVRTLFDFDKVSAEASNFFKSIPKLWSDETKHAVFVDILGEGAEKNPYTTDKKAYIEFQLGFLNGYIGTYVIVQIAGVAIPVGGALKLLTSGAKLGQVTSGVSKVAIMTARISKAFKSQEIGSILAKMKIAEKVAGWSEESQDALASLIKLAKDKKVKDVEKWLDDAGEAGAKQATSLAKKIRSSVKLTDDQLANLMSTKLGRHTLAAADATEDLIVKQSKLVEKWGVKTADEVVTKCFLFWCDAERVANLKKITNAMPENFVKDFEPGKAVKFLGKKGFGDAVEKVYQTFTKNELSAVIKNVDDFESVGTGAEKILKFRTDLSLPTPTISGFPSTLETINDIGKLENVKGVDNLAHKVAKVGGGFPYEARRAVILKDTPGVKLLELGRKKDINFIDIDGSQKIRELDMDIFYEFSHQGKKIKVIEEIKSSSSGVVGATNEFKTQILKMTHAVKDGVAEQARAVTHGTFANDVKTFIQQNGNLVELVEGGI